MQISLGMQCMQGMELPLPRWEWTHGLQRDRCGRAPLLSLPGADAAGRPGESLLPGAHAIDAVAPRIVVSRPAIAIGFDRIRSD